MAHIQVLAQLICFLQQGIRNRDIFLHDRAVGFKQGGLVFLQKFFSFFSGKPQSQSPRRVEIGEHVAIERGVEVRGSLAFDFWIGRKEFAVKRLLTGGNVAFVLCAHDALLARKTRDSLIGPAEEDSASGVACADSD